MAADARRHGFRLAAGEEGLEVAAVAAEQEGEEAVVHEVAAVGRRRRAVGMDAEDDLRSGDLLGRAGEADEAGMERSEEHTSELQSLMRHSYAVFCLQKKKTKRKRSHNQLTQVNTN